MNLGYFGTAAVLGISAVGSAIGLAIAGYGAIGAWKKCYMNNKQAPGTLTIFAGAPLTQTLYGFLVMLLMQGKAANPANTMLLFGIGLVCGVAIAASAIAQGIAGACGADAQAETGQGFANYIIVVGLCETVAIFVMAFCILIVLGLPA